MKIRVSVAVLALALSTSAFASPGDDSIRGRFVGRAITKIVRAITHVLHPQDDPAPPPPKP